MNAIRKALIGIGALLTVGVLLFLVTFHATVHGLIRQKCYLWEEDSYEGRPLSELRSGLMQKGRSLVPVDPGSFYAMTGRTLQPNQHGVRFVKGERYPWFSIGSAVNVGYVVVEIEGDSDQIVEILHRRSVDAP